MNTGIDSCGGRIFRKPMEKKSRPLDFSERRLIRTLDSSITGMGEPDRDLKKLYPSTFPRFEEVLPHRGVALMFNSTSEIVGVGKEFYANPFLKEDPKTILIRTIILEDDKMFEGHFPERKVLPGHWQLEMMCQAAVVLVKCLEPDVKGLPALSNVESFRLSRPIMPRKQPVDIFVRVSLLEVNQMPDTSSALMYFFKGTIENSAGRHFSGASFTGMRHTFKER